MSVVRDRFWIWGHEAGSHTNPAYYDYGISGRSRMTPAEAAIYTGIPNMMMVCYHGQPEPPFEPLAKTFDPLKRVVWSIIGDGSSKRNDEQTDLDEVVALKRKHPNITGGIMDDFFGDKGGRYGIPALRSFRDKLHLAGLDLWVVAYSNQDFKAFKPSLDLCDVITLWTFSSTDLAALDDNFARLEAAVPGKRKVLGCYMWDYGPKRPMPIERMEFQCDRGLQWLKGGRIDGMIFLASCICDLDLEAVEWTRRWIASVGDRPFGRAK